jgi:hypothetical protein
LNTFQPPLCDNQGNNLRRKRRQTEEDGPRADFRIDHPSFARNATTVEVFGGFYVTDTTDSGETRLFDGEPIEEVTNRLPEYDSFKILKGK